MNELALQDNIKAKVFAAEAFMKTQPQLDLKVVDYFSEGIYARELHIPAGTLLTGEIHKFRNLNILSAGSMSVLTEDGMKRVSAPFTIVSPSGTKRIAYAHTDCIWTTVHGTYETNVDEIKRTFIASNEQEWLDFCNANQLEFILGIL
jgi:hypothetical protein